MQSGNKKNPYQCTIFDYAQSYELIEEEYVTQRIYLLAHFLRNIFTLLNYLVINPSHFQRCGVPYYNYLYLQIDINKKLFI